jgi:hypothetical protein
MPSTHTGQGYKRMADIQVPPLAVIIAALWAVSEISVTSKLHAGYRVSVCLAISFFAFWYSFTEFAQVSMHDRAFMLRSGLILLFSIAAIIARMVRHAVKGRGLL